MLKFPRRFLFTVTWLVVAGCAHVAVEDGDVYPGYVPMDSWRNADNSIWIASSPGLVERMLDLANLTPGDRLVDLGSGDGRIVLGAAQRGVRAHGIEYNEAMVEYASAQALAEGLGTLATFEYADIFQADFSDATVVTLFLMPYLNAQLRPILLEKLAPGARILSNSFDMIGWDPDETAEVTQNCVVFCRVMKWVVPARVNGAWTLDDGRLLTIEQRYQHFRGTVGQENIANGHLDGARIRFALGAEEYTGRVEGTLMEGLVNGVRAWRAAR